MHTTVFYSKHEPLKIIYQETRFSMREDSEEAWNDQIPSRDSPGIPAQAFLLGPNNIIV